MASPTNSNAIQAALARPGYLPPGVTAEFLEQSRDGPVVVGILFVGVFATLVVALRCLARFLKTKKIGPDDWLILAAMPPYWAFIALCVILIHLGSGRHFLYIEYILPNKIINKTEILDFAAHIIYTTTLVFGRLSGLAFYRRIADRHPRLMRANQFAAVFIIAAYLPQLFLIVFHCLPVTGLWPYSFQPRVDEFKCLQWGTIYVTNSAISVVCDLILFSIPVAIIHSLRLKLIKKIQLSCILMPGLLVIAISCSRMYLVIVGQWEADESWSYDYLLAIEVSEIGSTLVALSIPGLKPLLGSLYSSLHRTFTGPAETSKPDTGDSDHNGHLYDLGSLFTRAQSQDPRQSQLSGDIEMADINDAREAAFAEKGTTNSAKSLQTATEERVSGDSEVSQKPILKDDHDRAMSEEEKGHV